MKRILLNFLLLLLAIMSVQADETAAHDNRLYISLGESSDLSQVPVTLHLDNPTIVITAVEMYLTLPEGAEVSMSEASSRCTGSHAITSGETPRGYFVSVASESVENFTEREGAVCTLMCDFSSLADGSHTITASGMFAVGVSNDVVTSYTTENQSETITKNGDLVTGVEEITPSKGVLEIYNLQGIRLKAPQKGQINIINGKKVIL